VYVLLLFLSLFSNVEQSTPYSNNSLGDERSTLNLDGSQQVIGHRGRCWTHDEGPAVVLAVLVLVEDVHHRGHEGVEEGEDRNGDKELGGGGVISGQEQPFTPHPLTQRGLEGHLVQPDTQKGVRGGVKSTSSHTECKTLSAVCVGLYLNNLKKFKLHLFKNVLYSFIYIYN